jgi:hypothetical protein
MKSLGNETFTPSDQVDKEDPKTYTVKALSSLQLTEVYADGAKMVEGGVGLNFKGIMLCLKYGLIDTDISKISSLHHAELGKFIFSKASLLEEERKNS